MKIVDLDGYGLNPGDLDWAGFKQLGDFSNYDRTPADPAVIAKRIGAAEAILTNKTPITRDVLDACPSLRYIGVLATGFNVVDLVAAREHHVTVTNIPSYGTDAVAQHTFALLLEITNQVGLHNNAIHAGEWTHAKDFTFWKRPLMELTGKTLGLIGAGNISQAVAKRAHAFGMKVIFYNHRPKATDLPWFKQVPLQTVYEQADIISLHIPQTAENTGMINAAALTQMKPGAILINTARGGLLDEAAVAAALNAGKLGALGADVVATEPILADNPLLTAKNCYLTPHIAWAPTETRARLMSIAVHNLASYQAGQPSNVVS